MASTARVKATIIDGAGAKERLAKLAGGIAVIRVGGSSEVEVKEIGEMRCAIRVSVYPKAFHFVVSPTCFSSCNVPPICGSGSLTKDRDALLRSKISPPSTGNTYERRTPIESTFATVRHRTIRSKGCLSSKTALAMVFKLVEGAQRVGAGSPCNQHNVSRQRGAWHAQLMWCRAIAEVW